jgi:cytochrome c peroxidase
MRRPYLALIAAGLALSACGQPGSQTTGQSTLGERLAASLAAPDAHAPFVPELPFGMKESELRIPADNPLTKAKVALGHQLYFDERLSKDRTVSCATCHHPEKGWGDDAPVSTGIRGQKGGRSAPTVMNRALSTTQFWDGRAASLEEQALGPIGNPIEMGFSVDEAVKLLNTIPEYTMQFEKVFGGPANADRLAKAIAAFERTVIVGGAPYDYYLEAKYYLQNPDVEAEDAEEEQLMKAALAGWNANEMSESAIRGMDVYFNKGKCALCHVGVNFTDEQYHNLGVGMTKEAIEAGTFDKGREDHTKKEADRGAFKTPTLRNIVHTAPYMHDGSQKTLEEVVEFYDIGGHANPWLSPKVEKLGLTDQEKADLVAFMKEGLTSKEPAIGEPELPPDPQ